MGIKTTKNNTTVHPFDLLCVTSFWVSVHTPNRSSSVTTLSWSWSHSLRTIGTRRGSMNLAIHLLGLCFVFVFLKERWVETRQHEGMRKTCKTQHRQNTRAQAINSGAVRFVSNSTPSSSINILMKPNYRPLHL